MRPRAQTRAHREQAGVDSTASFREKTRALVGVLGKGRTRAASSWTGMSQVAELRLTAFDPRRDHRWDFPCCVWSTVPACRRQYHSDLETTLNFYTHALPASQRRAVERVSEVMFSMVLELGENEQDGKSKQLYSGQLEKDW
jgi:hypothetical protein